MSRIGKKPITLAPGVTFEVAGRTATVKGAKGTLSCELPETVAVNQEDQNLVVVATEESRDAKAKHGLARSLIQGMVTGVSEGFRKELQIQGVGYRGQVAGQTLTLNLGFSHPVVFEVPQGVSVAMPEPTRIVLESCDKQKVGQTAATIRQFRKPDAYKGKGVRYMGENISLKEGKTVG
jgi:large subunit ribosomal protein L6